MITQKELKQLFTYDKDIGIFTRNIVMGGEKKGNIAGYKSPTSIDIRVKYRLYRAHQLAWLYVYGSFAKEIDHINGNPYDNRICNLREATQSQNMMNTKVRNNNKIGIKGVSFDKSKNKWLVQVSVNKKRIFMKRFDNLELAELVAIEAREKYHGEFARHG